MSDMHTLLKRVSAPVYTGPVQFFVRGMHYSSLGTQVTSCPPTDFRTPHIVDMVNARLKQVAESSKVEYICVTEISGPRWGDARDWVHYSPKVYAAEAHHVTHRIFRHSITHKLPPRLDPGLVIYPENSVLRMQQDKTVYLYRDKQLRAFPDGHTFMAMGFDFDHVIVVSDSMHRYFSGKTMGEALPHI